MASSPCDPLICEHPSARRRLWRNQHGSGFTCTVCNEKVTENKVVGSNNRPPSKSPEGELIPSVVLPPSIVRAFANLNLVGPPMKVDGAGWLYLFVNSQDDELFYLESSAEHPTAHTSASSGQHWWMATCMRTSRHMAALGLAKSYLSHLRDSESDRFRCEHLLLPQLALLKAVGETSE